MPNNPFDRVIINSREKPLSADINKMQSQLDRALRFFAKTVFSSVAGAPKSGFSAGGFKAVESSPQALSVVLKAGLGFQDNPTDLPSDINGITGLDDIDSYKPLPLLSDLTVPIPTAPAGPNSRIDIIEVRADRLVTDSQGRDIFNVTTEEFQSSLVDKTLEFLLDGSKLGTVNDPAPSTSPLSLKVGVAANPGVAPVTTAGYIKIAEVFVDSAVTVITDLDITDSRTLLGIAVDPKINEVFIPAALGQTDWTFPGPTRDAYQTSGAWHVISGRDFDIALDLTPALRVGDRVLSVTAYCHDVPATNPIQFDLIDVTQPGLNGVLVSDQPQSDQTGNEQTVDITNINFNGGTNVIESGHTYRVRCQELATPSFTNRFYGVKVTYDTPQ